MASLTYCPLAYMAEGSKCWRDMVGDAASRRSAWMGCTSLDGMMLAQQKCMGASTEEITEL
jgi:hypothetical protein